MYIKSDDKPEYKLWKIIKLSFSKHPILQSIQLLCIILNILVIFFATATIITYIAIVACFLAFSLNIVSARNHKIEE